MVVYEGNIEVHTKNNNGYAIVTIRKTFTKDEEVKEILKKAFDGEEIILKARIYDKKRALLKLNGWGVDITKYL